MKDKIREQYNRVKAMALYGEYYRKNRRYIEKLLCDYCGKKIAIWGAGLKGEAFLKVIDPNREKICFAIDKSESKNGTKMPTGHRIIMPRMILEQGIEVVISINYNHADSIRNDVEAISTEIVTVCLDLYLLQKEKKGEGPAKGTLSESIVAQAEFFKDRIMSVKKDLMKIKTGIGKLGSYKIEDPSPIFFYYGQYSNVVSRDNEGEAYGLFENLKRYSEFTKHIYAKAEHGMYFHDWVYFSETVEANVPAVFTFSKKRKAAIWRASQRLAYPIGPYIHYGKRLYSDFQISVIKENLGKTLLVFPEHSTHGANQMVQTEESIAKIRAFKEEHGFETVLVCFHYWDIVYGKHFRYQKEGWIPVTAGIGNSIKFYDNLKTIISLGDFCLQSGLGTSLGYCVYLGKPTMLYNQPDDIVLNRDKKTNQPLEQVDNYLTLGTDEEILTKLFSEYHEAITEQQYEICSKIWGFDSVRSKEEIYTALRTVRKIALCAPKTESGFYAYAKKLFQNSRDKAERQFLQEVLKKN